MTILGALPYQSNALAEISDEQQIIDSEASPQ